MKIAVFADIHGNQHAFEAVLTAIEKEQVDMTVCAGDAINAFPGSAQVWRTLKSMGIPMVRGNHEEYVLAYHHPARNPAIRSEVRFMPAQYTAKQFTADEIAEMDALPLTHIIAGPNKDDILVCHASPSQTRHSFAAGIDEEMAADLASFPQKIIIGGHIHQQWRRTWRDKELLLCGSAGWPINDSLDAEYLILTHTGNSWHAEHKSTPYNLQAMVDTVLDSGFLLHGGPIAWLMLDELLSGQMRVGPFLGNFCHQPEPVTLTDWTMWVQRYLEAIDRWDIVKIYVNQALSV